MNQSTSFPQPAADESYEDFVMRAHRDLFAAIPEPMDRNRAVWNAWEATKGDNERYRVRALFPTDKFVRRDDYCYWQEHTAVQYDADGTPIERNNDVNRIVDIIRENNERIADTDSFSAVVEGHTKPPTKDPITGKIHKDEKDSPATLGFTGPFRLGMIGRIKPRFAAFADEFQRTDKQGVLADRPRRSVEVLTLKANGRSYFDPIAALSESPRLPLPLTVHYSADGEEFERERYEAVEAFPGGSNTYLPGGGESRKKPNQLETYSVGEPNSNQAGKMFPNQQDNNGQGAAPDQTRTIVDAIMGTPLMKFLQQFAESNGFNSQGGPPAAAAQPPAAAPAPNQFGAGMNPSMRYSADSTDTEDGLDDLVEYEIDESGPTVEQFSALAADVQRLMAENAGMKKRQVELAATNADAKRSAELGALHAKHPHFIDLDAEKAVCLYSAGATMTDDAFDAHLSRLETYAAKAPPISGRMVPGGESGVSQPDDTSVERANYEAEVSARSLEIYTAELAKGNVLNSDEAYAMAEKEFAVTADQG